jgi:phospholipid/cholesterol/gamma-HCH transport system substrate-binding protein
METRANHVLIGLFTLLVAFGLVLFALWAAKYSSDKNFNEYDVVFKESVTGLGNGGIVQYNGIAVGEVRKLWLDPKDPNRVIVRIRVGAETPVKVDTKAKLAFIGLTGVAQIQLSGGSGKSADLKPIGDQRIAVIHAEESALNKLFNSAEDITTTAAEMLLRLNRMLSEENVARITATLDHLESITGTVDAQKKDIAEILRNARDATAKLDRTLANAEGAMGKVDATMVSVQKDLPVVLAKLDKTLSEFEALGRNANGLLVDNRDGINSLGRDGLTQIGPTLSELRGLVRQLNKLSARLEHNPAGFILGRGKPEEFTP